MILSDIKSGDRVELAPGTYAYRDGYRTGEVLKVGGRIVLVKCGDNDVRAFHPSNLARVLP